ncbi:unnamed protein product [Symbiodinium natans]|uniref:Uncharacterized protein n=1 Tax=Symbiodinium natans TaxID=878477 RepID=A0A812IGR0_9DINO|nr:unnamed protein product [Symbiodinium natans]
MQGRTEAEKLVKSDGPGRERGTRGAAEACLASRKHLKVLRRRQRESQLFKEHALVPEPLELRWQLSTDSLASLTKAGRFLCFYKRFLLLTRTWSRRATADDRNYVLILQFGWKWRNFSRLLPTDATQPLWRTAPVARRCP